MRKKLPFKYYAIRIGNSIVIRRTVKHLTKVQSTLYSTRTDFRLVQTSYTGGKIVATMPYADWTKHEGNLLLPSQCVKLTRERFRALEPFMLKGQI